MLFIVDGTGPYDYEQYDRDFSKSFCSQMFKQKTAFAKYYPGPGTLGISTHVTANICTRDVVKTFTESRKTKIYLAGYSRGGAAVMQVAKWCAGYTITTFTSAPRKFSFGPAAQTATPIPIEAMFLLDPVTKDFSVDGIGVPSNVKKCYVMYRDQTIVPFSPPFNLSDWKSDLDVTLAIGAHFDPDRYARKFMENAVVCPEKGNNVTKFMVGFYDGSFGVRVHRKTIRNASHGAIGGLPWPERKLDIGASRDAADAVNSWLKFEGLPIKVSVADFSAETLKKYKPMSDAEIAAKQVEIEQRERLRVQQIHREMLDAGPKY